MAVILDALAHAGRPIMRRHFVDLSISDATDTERDAFSGPENNIVRMGTST